METRTRQKCRTVDEGNKRPTLRVSRVNFCKTLTNQISSSFCYTYWYSNRGTKKLIRKLFRLGLQTPCSMFVACPICFLDKNSVSSYVIARCMHSCMHLWQEENGHSVALQIAGKLFWCRISGCPIVFLVNTFQLPQILKCLEYAFIFLWTMTESDFWGSVQFGSD